MEGNNEISKQKTHNKFTELASSISRWTGRPSAFLMALGGVVLWAVTGPVFGFSETWQMIINTSTTIITFLMVFLIQNTQNRDMYAVQLKLDELIRSTQGAHTELLDLEELSEEELCGIRDQYEELAEKARKRLEAGQSDTHVPDVDIHGKTPA